MSIRAAVFPKQNPIGRHLGRGTTSKPDIEIVGVVKDATYAIRRSRIRLALGAGSAHVRNLVVREVAVMLAVGTLAGVAAAAAAGKFVQSFLFGMKPLDTLVYGLAAGLLWLIALGAAYVPARSAIRVDPMVALRYE